MCSYEKSDDCLSIARMNSEIHYAQREILSARRATHQLRLHYSADDLVRSGRRDVLRKSAEAASFLHEFYSAIEKRIPQPAQSTDVQLTGAQVAQAIEYVSSYLREQREQHLFAAQPLSSQHKARMGRIFRPPCSTMSASSSSTVAASPRPLSMPRPVPWDSTTSPKSLTWTP